MFGRVDPEIVATLRAIVGERHVLTGREALEPYTHDEVAGLRADPEVVLYVESADQVSRVMRLALESDATRSVVSSVEVKAK